MKDDLRLVGILSERELDGRILLKELRKILFDCLQLGPMYQPLVDILEKNGKVITSQVGEFFTEIKDVFTTIHSTAFLTTTPLFLNHRETYANIMLITTSVMITRKSYMTIDEIRHGLLAYTLISRECKNEWLPMYVEKIIKAFRMVNKTISEVILKKWFEHVRSNLECNQESRIYMEKEIKQKKLDVPFLLPHEFLYLLCNSSDRLETINRLHNPELVSQKGNIYQWELRGKEDKQNQATHIHLLPQTAFSNQAPHILLTQTLNKEAEEKNIKILGLKPQLQQQQNLAPVNEKAGGNSSHNRNNSIQSTNSPNKINRLMAMKQQQQQQQFGNQVGLKVGNFMNGQLSSEKQYQEMKKDLKSMKHSAIEILGNAKKFQQRFQSPYLEIMQNASQHTIDKINSPNAKKDNFFMTQQDNQFDFNSGTSSKKKRPQTAKPMTPGQIKDRNRTFMHVSKINLKRAQIMKQQELFLTRGTGFYKPPDKSIIKSQFTEMFSEKDQIKECEAVSRSLVTLNISKSRETIKLQRRATDRVKHWMAEELQKFEDTQTEKSRAQATTAIDASSEANNAYSASGFGVGSSKKFEKMLDYVQNFSNDPSYSSLPKRRPVSSYSYKTTFSSRQQLQNGLKSHQMLTFQQR
eukprot:403335284